MAYCFFHPEKTEKRIKIIKLVQKKAFCESSVLEDDAAYISKKD
jgi:hypothetical protein